MAQVNLTLSQEEVLQVLSGNRDDAFKFLVERILNEIMLVESSEQLGALKHERTSDRKDYRNGSRERILNTRIGTLTLEVPRHRNEPFHTKILEVLKMSPGPEKANKMEKQIKRVLNNAEKHFNKYLKKDAINISNEVNKRLSMRLSDQEKYMEMKINRLEKLENESKLNGVNVELIVNEISPQLEAAQCTISILQTDF